MQTQQPFWKGVYYKRKEFASFLNRRLFGKDQKKNNLMEFPPLKVHPFMKQVVNFTVQRMIRILGVQILRVNMALFLKLKYSLKINMTCYETKGSMNICKWWIHPVDVKAMSWPGPRYPKPGALTIQPLDASLLFLWCPQISKYRIEEVAIS